MGTVGLNFGSATSGAGFDVNATVTSILGIQQAIETPYKNQLNALQAQDTVFTTLGSDLATLTNSLQALTDASGVFASKKGSSSDTNVLTLTAADTTAVAGSHTVVVTSLASTASQYSDSIAHASDILSGSLTINGHQISVVSGTSDTISSFSAAINAASIGVTSSIISDANGTRLSIVSNTSGSAGALSLTSALDDGNTAIGFTQGQPGANASLSVDGLPISNASNTVAGAIPGVTFQLLAQAPGTNVQIQVTNDNTTIESAVRALATAYNAVLKDISGQEKNDSSGKPEPLFGSPTLSLIQTQLQGAVFGGAVSGSINSLTQLGVTVSTDGTLQVDTSALDAALNSHFSDITGFFQNSASFGQKFLTTVNTLGTGSVTGAVSTAQKQNSAQEAALNASVAAEDTLIASEKITLTTELNVANEELQAIPGQLLEVNQIYSAISGYNQQK